MRKPLHIAIGSTTSKPGDVEGNLRQIADFAERAGRDGVDLLLTPELSASGYGGYPDVLATAEPAGDGPMFRALAATARATGVVVCAGFVERNGAKRHLAHYAVYPDSSFVIQRKHRVTPVERPLDPVAPQIPQKPDDDCGMPESLHMSYFHVKGVKCAILICADAGITDINETLLREGVELVLGPCGAGGKLEERVRTTDLATEEGRAKYLAMLETVFFPGEGAIDCVKYRRTLAAVNLCGYDGRQHAHLGHGMIITPIGEVPALFHGIPNLDRQRPMYAHAVVDMAETVH